MLTIQTQRFQRNYMNRTTISRTLLSLTLILSIASASATWSQSARPAPRNSKSARKPNVVFIVSDDLNNHLGTYGYPVKTPNLDRLAQQGIRFDRAYAQYPLCNPSRTSFISGRRPSTTGVTNNVTPPRTYLKDTLFMPQHFRRNGYFVARVGKILHVSRDGEKADFDDPSIWDVAINENVLEGQELAPYVVSRQTMRVGGGTFRATQLNISDDKLGDGQVATRSLEVMNQAKKSGKPFFLGIGIRKPHGPWEVPKKYFDLYPPGSIKLPQEPVEAGANGSAAAAAEPRLDRDARRDRRRARRDAAENTAPNAANDGETEIQDAETEDTESEDTGRRARPRERRGERRGSRRGNAQATDAERRQVITAYYACVSYMDAQVGIILDSLERLKLADDTIVVFMGDHGYHLGEHNEWRKGTLFEESARAPLIMRVPGKRAGLASPRLVEFVDLYPTLAELSGLPAPAGVEGTSFVPLLNDPNRAWKKAAFTQVRGGNNARHSIRTERYAYIEGGNEPVELYDHKTDPGEFKNLAADPKYAATLAEMRATLRAGWQAARPASTQSRARSATR